MKSWLLLALISALFAGCTTPKEPLRAEDIGPGWKIFATPRDFDSPGTIFGVKEGKPELISNHVPSLSGREERIPETRTWIRTRNQLRVLWDLLGMVPVSAGFKGDTFTEQVVMCKTSGAKRYSLTSPQVKHLLAHHVRSNNTQQIHEYSEYLVIAEATRVREVEYSFQESTINAFGGDVTFNSQANASGKKVTDTGKQKKMVDTFEKPLFLFYSDQAFTPEQVIQIKEEFKNKPLPPELKLTPLKTVEVRFEYLDVYRDGSKGADKWSTWCSINGAGYSIWDQKPGIWDGASENLGPGPRGEKHAKRFKLNKTFTAQLSPDQDLSIRFWGVAHKENNAVPNVGETFTKEENHGISAAGGKRRIHKMGDSNGKTSYYVHFSIKEIGEVNR
ncbi:MAG: hypothetical protein SFY81_02555 [Verrucomicrobiota bacterium]|nr:hypothetical protein [Verrucomicrobiota bacterium]